MPVSHAENTGLLDDHTLYFHPLASADTAASFLSSSSGPYSPSSAMSLTRSDSSADSKPQVVTPGSNGLFGLEASPFGTLDHQSLMSSMLFSKTPEESPSSDSALQHSAKPTYSEASLYNPASFFPEQDPVSAAYAAAARLSGANAHGAMDDESFADFMASLVNDDEEACPELEADLPEPEIPSFLSLEELGISPASTQPSALLPLSADGSPSTDESPFDSSSTYLRSESVFSDRSQNVGEAPANSSRGSAPASRRTRKATGFRGPATQLIAVNAPIQQRKYNIESSTSRKRKTTAVERKLAKRVAVGELDEVPQDDEAIPEDLLEAAERKRLQNTLSARKSRQRKQERLGELEIENQLLKEKNEQLEDRVRQLEAILAGMDVSP